jgi:hypothetical protein
MAAEMGGLHDAGVSRMAKLYKIPDWDANYENNRSRDIKRPAYFLCPVRFDDDALNELIEHKNGAAFLGAWRAIQATAATCRPRGTLVRGDGRPHDADSLSRKTRLPTSLFVEVLPRLVSLKLLEMQVVEDAGTCGTPQEGAANLRQTCGESATELNGTELNGTERNGNNTPLPPKGGEVFPGALDTDEFLEAWDRWKTYRAEIKKRLTPTTIKQQLKTLETMGHDDAIRSIDQSIGAGWIGLFPADGRGSTPSAGRGPGQKPTAGAIRSAREFPDDAPLPILNPEGGLDDLHGV